MESKTFANGRDHKDPKKLLGGCYVTVGAPVPIPPPDSPFNWPGMTTKLNFSSNVAESQRTSVKLWSVKNKLTYLVWQCHLHPANDLTTPLNSDWWEQGPVSEGWLWCVFGVLRTSSNIESPSRAKPICWGVFSSRRSAKSLVFSPEQCLLNHLWMDPFWLGSHQPSQNFISKAVDGGTHSHIISSNGLTDAIFHDFFSDSCQMGFLVSP